MIPNAYEVSPELLRKTIDPSEFELDGTRESEALEGVIGQQRALSALEFGLGMKERGFNVYVAGPHGSGKMTTIRAFLENLAGKQETPPDWCYVNNFEDPYSPTVLNLPAGMGQRLKQDMKNMIEHLRKEIPKSFESEQYSGRKEEITGALTRRKAEIVEGFGEIASHSGFVVQSTPFGVALMPVLGERVLSDAEFHALPVEAQQKIQERKVKLEEQFKQATKEIREIEQKAQEQTQELDRKVILYVVGGLIEDLESKFKDFESVLHYLSLVQKAILENIAAFKPVAGQEALVTALAGRDPDLIFRKYEVNVFVDNSKNEGAPVVLELNPTFNNLFGRVEKEAQFASFTTDFTLIKSGALHRANGGYLVVHAEDLLRNPFSWDGLKRMLQSCEIQIEDLGERLGFMATKSLRPQPIPLNVKVVLVGSPLIYHLMLAYDNDFVELFKVKADFDTQMKLNAENVRSFFGFLCAFCKKENIRPLDSSAVAKVLEHACRMAEEKDNLSTQFGALANVIREADYWASLENSESITAESVRKALDSKVYRCNLIQERLQDLMLRGTILMSTTGTCIGRVNALSVVDMGDYAFGRPNKITASIGPGRAGILDIEREVKLGGPLHSKGILVLGGYLTRRYAQEAPLSLSCRLVFEQSYSAIDGDSASSAELSALLSALSGLPVSQGIAITGSVNQLGELQAIGGVNEKVEGFFDLCKARGLDGNQGVIIPRSNIQNLMLREDVVEAVRSKTFHVWAATNIDQAMEVLTETPAGDRTLTDRFPPNTVNYMVEHRLNEMAKCLSKLEASSAREYHEIR